MGFCRTEKIGRSSRTTRMTLIAIGALVTSILTGPITAPPALGAAKMSGSAQPVTGAVFNKPTGTTAEQYAIRDHLLGLVDGTPAGATISMSIYHLTDDERVFADALIAAVDRGVKVRLVFESEYVSSGSAQALVTKLGRDKTKPNWAAICNAGCHGSKINHNKFYLFSNVAGQANVVVQSSANLTISNSRKYWNNAVTFAGNAELYNAFVGYFNDLSRDLQNLDYYKSVGAGNVKTYWFPRAGTTSDSDTVVNTLGNVGCAGGTTIKVAMWYFGRVAIANSLASLAGQGCKVDVVYTEILAEPYAALNGRTNVRLRQLDDGTYIVHSKYLIIDGPYAGVDRKTVFTGSHNYSNAALRTNDETMLRIYSDPIHDQYAANFAAVWAAAA